MFLKIKLEGHDGKEITVEHLVERYYKDPENYFEASKDNGIDTANNEDSSNSCSVSSPNTTEVQDKLQKISNNQYIQQGEKNNHTEEEISDVPKLPISLANLRKILMNLQNLHKKNQ
jgi:hypothetical protein